LIPSLYCSAAEDHKLAVVISKNILPYKEAVEGLNGLLSPKKNLTLKTYILENFPNKDVSILKKELLEKNYKLFIAIGPEALHFFSVEFSENDVPVVFSMVLNPEHIIQPKKDVCGISLQIPVERQLDEIVRVLPSLKRLGLLFDPKGNRVFFKVASEKGIAKGLKIVPLRVSSKKEIPGMLKSNWHNVDCIWLIPDRSVISESIVQYIIKEALLKEIPSIGYNRFFYETGALISFIFDYRELGIQTGRQVLLFMENETCQNQSPVFQTWINKGALKTLKNALQEDFLNIEKLSR
jgi:putative ABC transport system substrate-binding protein